MCVCAKSLQSCLTLCNPVDCSLPGSSVHRIFQARILEGLAMPFSRGCSWFRDWTLFSLSPALASGFFTTGTTFSSVLFSRLVVSDSLRPHGPQHARPPCPTPTPGVYPNSSPLSRWCHPTISSSVVAFSSHLQSFKSQRFEKISQLFKWVSSSTLGGPRYFFN